MDILQPHDWRCPNGYANGIAASGRMIFASGMVGWDAQEIFRTTAFVGQARRALDRHFPAMTAVQVAALIEDAARVDIEVTAVIPDRAGIASVPAVAVYTFRRSPTAVAAISDESRNDG